MSKLKGALTVLKDSDITTLPIHVKHVHYFKSIKELAEVKVTVESIVLTLYQVNSGYLPTTLVLTAPDISMIEIGSMLLMLLALHVLMVNLLKTKLTPVHNVHIVIIIGLMLPMENAEIAQMIPFSRNQITLVSLVLMVTNILLIEIK